MASTIFDFDINKNAVIFHYFSGCTKPHRCVVSYLGLFISASVFDHKFTVFSNSLNLSKQFESLREAKNFCKEYYNKHHYIL